MLPGMTRLGLSDTIAAVATAPGSAGVGIVRVSGPRALALADAVFRGRRSPTAHREAETAKAHRG